jgi:hypothetical protein
MSYTGGDRYYLEPNVCEIPRVLCEFNDRFNLGEPVWDGIASSRFALQYQSEVSAYTVCETFFDAVVDALKAMKGRLVLEVIHGDLMQSLSRIRLGKHGNRPQSFPAMYDRVWLSNVPYACPL